MQGERVRAGGRPPEEGCVVCGSPLEGPRCGHCGVAAAPGGFRVLRQLSKGPYSRMFLAEKDGRQVALKELVFALVPEVGQLEGFEREARLLGQLRHPAIPRLVESFREGEGVNTRLYLAQDFVRGRSLLQELERHRYDEREAEGIARELLQVLGYLHGLSPRVIHRDLKPANVMRREDGSLALVDFGAARDLVRGVTHGATLVGTFGYMPPEQLGGTVDQTSDLYALGATLLHLLTRRPPEELFRPGEALDLDTATPNVSEGFRGWLGRLVARDRGERFQSVSEALAALDALRAPPAVAPVRPSRLPLALSGVGLAVLGALVVGWPRPAPPPPPLVPRPAPVAVAPRAPDPAPPVAPPVEARPAPPPVAPPQPSRPRPAVASAPARPAAPGLVAVVAPRPLPPFALAGPFTAPLALTRPLPGRDAAGQPCDPASALTVESVRGVPGAPGALLVSVALENRGASAACASVFVELLDQAGGRDPSRATLVSNPAAGTVARRELRFPLPADHQRVQLRAGPQARPLLAVDVDLAQGTATAR